MKAINIMWDVDYPEDLEQLPNEVQIPSYLKDEEDISDYLSDLTGFCHKGFQLVPDSTDEDEPHDEENVIESEAHRGIDLPLALVQTLHRNGANSCGRVSSRFKVFDEADQKYCFSVQLKEKTSQDDPFQTTYNIFYTDNGGNSILRRILTVNATSIIGALRRELREVLSDLFHKDAYWLFGKAELPLVERYLRVMKDVKVLAKEMVARSQDGGLFTLAVQLSDDVFASCLPDIQVRLLNRSNSEFPPCVEVICSVEPSFIDLRPVAGLDQADAIASILDEVLQQVAFSLAQNKAPFLHVGVWDDKDPYELLRQTQAGDEPASVYMHDGEVRFAYALHKLFGYKVECLCAAPAEVGDPWYCRIIHAYCVDGNYLIDARGVTTDREEFFEPWKRMMAPMQETIVLPTDTIENALRCTPSDAQPGKCLAAADFIRSFCDVYDIQSKTV